MKIFLEAPALQNIYIQSWTRPEEAIDPSYRLAAQANLIPFLTTLLPKQRLEELELEDLCLHACSDEIRTTIAEAAKASSYSEAWESTRRYYHELPQEIANEFIEFTTNLKIKKNRNRNKYS
jgi:hypothetical protein